VTIGSRRLARSFFNVYRSEAAQHVATLETEYDGWCNEPNAEAPQALLRAAHTLATSHGGLTEIADLAGAATMVPPAPQVTDERDLSAERQRKPRKWSMQCAGTAPIPADFSDGASARDAHLVAVAAPPRRTGPRSGQYVPFTRVFRDGAQRLAPGRR
jgi:hypothetical protein